jgi:hypothetical protein
MFLAFLFLFPMLFSLTLKAVKPGTNAPPKVKRDPSLKNFLLSMGFNFFKNRHMT